MRKSPLLAMVLALSLIVLMWGYGALVMSYSSGGPWWMMGPGMMESPGGAWGGYGPGALMRGHGPGAGRDLNLSADAVKSNVERWLAWQGNPRLRVGDVREKDADTIVADVVTRDNSLVQRFAVDRHSGFVRSSEE